MNIVHKLSPSYLQKPAYGLMQLVSIMYKIKYLLK